MFHHVEWEFLYGQNFSMGTEGYPLEFGLCCGDKSGPGKRSQSMVTERFCFAVCNAGAGCGSLRGSVG